MKIIFEKKYAHFYKLFLMTRKSNAEKAWIFVYPMIGIFSIGFLASYIEKIGGDINSIPFILIGVVVWSFYELCQKAPIYGILLDIWDQCLKHNIASPSEPEDFIVGTSAFGLASAAFVTLYITAVSIPFFGFSIFDGGITTILALLTTFIFATSVGLMVNALITSKDKAYTAISWSTPGIIMIFSGVYYPAEFLPKIAQYISYILPTTYTIEAIRQEFGFDPTIISPLLKGFFLSVAYMVAGIIAYTKGLKSAKKTGITITD